MPNLQTLSHICKHRKNTTHTYTYTCVYTHTICTSFMHSMADKAGVFARQCFPRFDPHLPLSLDSMTAKSMRSSYFLLPTSIPHFHPPTNMPTLIPHGYLKSSVLQQELITASRNSVFFICGFVLHPYQVKRKPSPPIPICLGSRRWSLVSTYSPSSL